MKRIFIALEIKPEGILLDTFSMLKHNLKNEAIKWTKPENIHITLVFLGDTSEAKISPLCEMLREKCDGFGMFDLTLNGTGIFRSISDPRIIWIGLMTSEKLLKLNRAIVNGLGSIGIKTEERPFNPHLTLGRIKHINDNETFKTEVERYKNQFFQLVPVSQVILYESILLQTGPIFKQLGCFSLL